MKASRRSNKAKGQSSPPQRAEGVILDSSNVQSRQLNATVSQPLLLGGPLDQYAAESLRTKALSLLDSEGDAVFDFRDIDRMHTASLQVLIALQKDLEPKGRQVILKSVDPGLRRLFRISGTEEFFKFSEGSH